MIFLLSADLFYHSISERLVLRPLLKIKMAILYIQEMDPVTLLHSTCELVHASILTRICNKYFTL